jgi:hypothetical protein
MKSLEISIRSICNKKDSLRRESFKYKHHGANDGN